MPSRRSSSTRRYASNQRLSGGVAVVFLVLMAALLYFGGKERSQQNPTVVPPANPNSGGSSSTGSAGTDGANSSGAISVFFTDPSAGGNTRGPENELIAAIDGAKNSVDMAIYNLTLDSIGQALFRAKGRGVTVRLVMESESLDKKLPQSLIVAGIPIIGDNREGLMHNKFTVIDNQEVFTGSPNYTSTSFYNDFNNLVSIRSQRVAKDYMVEFEEMFSENLFGPDGRAVTPYPQVTLDGTLIEVYFSPDDKVASKVLPILQSAKTSIDIMAYSFTRDDFAQAIRDRAAAGVTVRGVFDESQATTNIGGEYDQLKKDGYDVHLDGIEGLLHNKVIIVDGETVITGSYNFTASAERTNDENLIIIHDPRIAQAYLKNFETVYKSAQK
jgi:phosphatidylserine/phosphatidylglycerophosphate/cardiolipin synthase-like enzyme